MAFIPPELVKQARQMDLLTYLQVCDPQELVHFSGCTYTTKSHDSLKISNGKWYWFSRGIGGRSALDYLIQVQELPFLEAVERILGYGEPPKSHTAREPPREKKLLLPKPYRSVEFAVSYLKRRGIAEEIIRDCLRMGLIYESAGYHSVVFVGRDPEGTARYAAVHGVTAEGFKGEASGSEKRYSFSVTAEGKSRKVHVFESPIDLLSYGTLLQMAGKSWRSEHLLSLGGVYPPGKNPGKGRLPAALHEYLRIHPEADTVCLHLDRDPAGRLAVELIRETLPRIYQMEVQFPVYGKDVNEELCRRLSEKEDRNEETWRDQR